MAVVASVEDEDSVVAVASEADSVELAVAVDEATPLTRSKEVNTKARCRVWIKRWTLSCVEAGLATMDDLRWRGCQVIVLVLR